MKLRKTFVRSGGGYPLLNKITKPSVLLFVIMFLVAGLSIGYSAFASQLNITGLVTKVRLKSDIRVTGLTLDSSSNQGQSIYNEYNKKNINMGVKLPQNTSTVTYKVEVTNIGNVEMGILSIDNLPEDLDYELKDYEIKTKICPTGQTTNCKLGIKKEFYITIKYKENVMPTIPAVDYTYNLNLSFNFKQAYNVTYEGITNNNYVSSVIEGETLEVEFKSPIPPKVVPYINGEKVEYTYENNKITVPNVTSDITLKYQEKAYLATLGSGTYFKESAHLKNIKTVTFQDTIDIPSNTKVTYDLSSDGDKSIMGWIDENYNLYIGSEWNIYSKDLSYAFYNMSGVTNIYFNNLNTSEATTMRNMFDGMSNLTSLDISKFNTSNVTSMQYMFQKVSKLTSLNLSNFNTSSATAMYNMFYGMSSLTSLDVSSFNTSKVTRMDYMFYGLNGLTSLDLSSFNTSKVTNMSSMFYKCSKLTTLNLKHFNTSNVTNMYYMFTNCSNLTSLDVSSFDTSNVTNMGRMFHGLSKVSELDLSNFNTSKVTQLHGMFYEMSNLTSLDISSFVTTNVTSMYEMFYKCNKLTELNINHFDTSKVTSMNSMFNGMSSLTSLDLSHFDTSKVTDMYGMFSNMSLLKTIYVSDKWTTSAVTNSSDMFSNVTNIVGGNGTKYNSSYIDKTYARIDTTETPGYLTRK